MTFDLGNCLSHIQYRICTIVKNVELCNLEGSIEKLWTYSIFIERIFCTWNKIL